MARYHAFINTHPDLFEHTASGADVLLVWNYDNWLRRDDCPTARLARELAARNIQFDVMTESQLDEKALQRYHPILISDAEPLSDNNARSRLRSAPWPGPHVLVVSLAANKARSVAPEHITHQPGSVNDVAAMVRPQFSLTSPPGVRAVVRRSAKDDYRLSAIVAGVVTSDAFRMQAR